MEDRDLDKKHFIIPEYSRTGISKDVIKSKFIAEGKNAEEIAKETGLELSLIENLIVSEKLPELRKAYIIKGINQIQNQQITQAEKLLNLENNFKSLRILQLEAQLETFFAYLARHGDLYRRHPTTGEILEDANGMPMQLKVPNVAKELLHLKESVTLSEGFRNMLGRLDSIINSGPKLEYTQNSDIIEVDYKSIFGDENE
jgi:hypothetical protein